MLGISADMKRGGLGAEYERQNTPSGHAFNWLEYRMNTRAPATLQPGLSRLRRRRPLGTRNVTIEITRDSSRLPPSAVCLAIPLKKRGMRHDTRDGCS